MEQIRIGAMDGPFGNQYSRMNLRCQMRKQSVLYIGWKLW